MPKKGFFVATTVPIISDAGPPWPFAKSGTEFNKESKNKIPRRVRAAVPVGEGCTLYLSLPDDSSLPSTISMRLKAYATMVDSYYQISRSEDVVSDWLEPTDLTINFSGNQVFTIGKGSLGQATVKFQFTDQPFIDDPDSLAAEVSILGYASSGGIEYYLNYTYVILPS